MSRPIVATQGTCGGLPRIYGTRIPCFTLQAYNRQGIGVSQIRKLFPQLSYGEIVAAIAYPDAKRPARPEPTDEDVRIAAILHRMRYADSRPFVAELANDSCADNDVDILNEPVPAEASR